MLSLLPVVFMGTLSVIEPAAPGPTTTAAASIPSPVHMLFVAPERRVRAADARVQSLLLDGFRRSPTFASLLVALNKSDVIVYVEKMMTLPKNTMGRLTIVPIPGPQRYLRIQIRAELVSNEAIALIAHEMQHALEVAACLEVRDAGGMIKLYERIGHSSGGEHVYDTIAAQDTGRQVRRELVL
jgi:hypothetical protein